MGARPLRRLGEAELAKLPDEALVDYIAAAREADDLELAKRACGVLAFGHEPRIKAWVAAKVPRRDVDDVVATVLESVVKSLYDSQTVGQFVAWLRTITRRRIADYHRALEGKPPLGPIPDGGSDDKEAEPGSEEDGYIGFDTRTAAAQLLASRSPLHADVIKLNGPNELGYLGLSAAETVERIAVLHPSEEMTNANVHQIWSRFRRELQDQLGLGGSPR